MDLDIFIVFFYWGATCFYSAAFVCESRKQCE